MPDASQTSGLAWQIQPAARVYNDADLDAGTATWTTLTFNTERYDTDTVHSTSSNTGRLTVPTGGGGIYSIGACAEFETGISANAASVVGLRIRLNGSTVIAQDLRDTYRAETNNLAMCIQTQYALVATDYVEVQAYTEQDVNVAASGNYSPEFWLSWQRRA